MGIILDYTWAAGMRKAGSVLARHLAAGPASAIFLQKK
jgi:hypothetical protein